MSIMSFIWYYPFDVDGEGYSNKKKRHNDFVLLKSTHDTIGIINAFI